MQKISKFHRSCLFAVVLTNASFAGDLKNRFKEDRPLSTLESTQGLLGGAEVVLSAALFGLSGSMYAVSTLNGEFTYLKGSDVSAKHLKFLRRTTMAAVLIGIDGTARVYLVSQGKNPTATPLLGLSAYAAVEGSKKVWKIVRNEKIDDGLEYIFDEKTGLLKSVEVKAKAALNKVQGVVNDVIGTARTPAEESSEH